MKSSLQADPVIKRSRMIPTAGSNFTPYEYRDRIYMRKDIILKLSEYGELNQTTLISYCGLNLTKHRAIFDSLEKKGFIRKTETSWVSKRIIKYSVTEKGLEFYKRILEPYEEMFPRVEPHGNFVKHDEAHVTKIRDKVIERIPSNIDSDRNLRMIPKKYCNQDKISIMTLERDSYR